MISSEIKQKSTPKFRFQEAPLPMEISTPIDFSSPTKRKKRLKFVLIHSLKKIQRKKSKKKKRRICRKVNKNFTSTKIFICIMGKIIGRFSICYFIYF